MTGGNVGVVNYGVGNLGSMLNMLRYLDLEAREITNPERIFDVDRLILPGVGSFDRGVAGLTADGLDRAIHDFVATGSPIMGICLGMQLLTRGSEEGSADGLALVAANCTRLVCSSSHERVPHMGWDWVVPTSAHSLVDRLPTPAKFYFAHSYAVRCDDEGDIVATTDFAGGFPSVIAHDNVVGAQFHPEKSHRFGMELLRSFAEWSP